RVMHQIKLIHQSALFEELQSAINGDTIEFGVFLLSQPIELLSIEMGTGLVDDIQQNLPLLSEADAPLFESVTRILHRLGPRIPDAGAVATADDVREHSRLPASALRTVNEP